MNKKKLIYIMSDVRSGSTLLENILSKSPEMLSVGELHHLDSHINKGMFGEAWDWNCSCGQSFQKCEFWVKIFRILKEQGIDTIENTAIFPVKPRFFRFLYTKCHWDDNPQSRESLNLLQHIYEAIFKATNREVIIDSSKMPAQALAIYENIGFDVKVIYLKREIRAVTYSKQKWQKKRFGKAQNIYKILFSTKLKDLRCLDCWRKIKEKDKVKISYEELSKKPQETIDLIVKKLDLPDVRVPEYMYLEDDHTVGGTANRFEKRKIEYDAAWESKIAKMPFLSFVGKLLDKL